MRRMIALFILAAFVLAACGAPVVDKSHENSPSAAEKKAQKAAGGDE